MPEVFLTPVGYAHFQLGDHHLVLHQARSRLLGAQGVPGALKRLPERRLRYVEMDRELTVRGVQLHTASSFSGQSGPHCVGRTHGFGANVNPSSVATSVTRL